MVLRKLFWNLAISENRAFWRMRSEAVDHDDKIFRISNIKSI